jgi:hypothetical protein
MNFTLFYCAAFWFAWFCKFYEYLFYIHYVIRFTCLRTVTDAHSLHEIFNILLFAIHLIYKNHVDGKSFVFNTTVQVFIFTPTIDFSPVTCNTLALKCAFVFNELCNKPNTSTEYLSFNEHDLLVIYYLANPSEINKLRTSDFHNVSNHPTYNMYDTHKQKGQALTLAATLKRNNDCCVSSKFTQLLAVCSLRTTAADKARIQTHLTDMFATTNPRQESLQSQTIATVGACTILALHTTHRVVQLRTSLLTILNSEGTLPDQCTSSKHYHSEVRYLISVPVVGFRADTLALVSFQEFVTVVHTHRASDDLSHARHQQIS